MIHNGRLYKNIHRARHWRQVGRFLICSLRAGRWAVCSAEEVMPMGLVSTKREYVYLGTGRGVAPILPGGSCDESHLHCV